MVHGEASEQQYAQAAREAEEKGDMRLALEMIGAALSFRPLSPEHRDELDRILAQTVDPLRLLPSEGSAFFGSAAVRAMVLARAGRTNEATLLLLEVVHFRPGAPYLVWLKEWRERSGMRGVEADATCRAVARFLAALDRVGESDGSSKNLQAAILLLAALRGVRPKALASIAVIEAMALRRLGDLDSAMSLVEIALSKSRTAPLLAQKAQVHTARGELTAAHEAMVAATAMAPTDLALRIDLADSELSCGLLLAAREGYKRGTAAAEPELVNHCEAACAYVDSLLAPERAVQRVREEGPRGGDARPLGSLFGLRSRYRSELPRVEDPLYAALLDVLGRMRQSPATGPIRLRVQLDAAVPVSARIAFNAGLSVLGLTGSIETDGEAAAPLSTAPHECDAAAEASVHLLSGSQLAIDDWCESAQAIPLGVARTMFDAVPDPGSDPMAALDRRRLGVLAAATAGICAPDEDALVWARELATGEDSWAARPALMVLATLARARPGLRTAVRAAFDAADERADPRRITLLGCYCLLPDLDPVERGARYKAWQEARLRQL